jgi:hypothetical protein
MEPRKVGMGFYFASSRQFSSRNYGKFNRLFFLRDHILHRCERCVVWLDGFCDLEIFEAKKIKNEKSAEKKTDDFCWFSLPDLSVGAAFRDYKFS